MICVHRGHQNLAESALPYWKIAIQYKVEFKRKLDDKESVGRFKAYLLAKGLLQKEEAIASKL